MKQYVDILKKIIAEGEYRPGERNGQPTLAIFGGQVEFDLTDMRIPLVSVKETKWQLAFLEMLWFLKGQMHTKFLHEHDCKLWDAWADENGNLGPIYGKQWRNWAARSREGDVYFIDQITNLIRNLKNKPFGRRHIVSAWNVGELDLMSLPPCHRDFQCFVTHDKQLDLMVAQRSWDMGLGAPFNIAQYGLLTHLLARATGLTARRLIFNYGDAHIYLNHYDKLKRMLAEKNPAAEWAPREPRLIIKTDNLDIDGYKPSDFAVENYSHGPHISLPIAV